MDDFEIDVDNPVNLQGIPTEVLVALCLAVIQELEVRLYRKEKLMAVN